MPVSSMRSSSGRRVNQAVAAARSLPGVPSQQRAAPGARRIGRPAGPDRRPLCRRAGRAVPVGGRGALARGDPRCARRGNRLRGDLRALGRGGAHARGPAAAGRGFVRGNREAKRCPIVEYGLHYRVDVEAGQKTGFFLDQRENRQRVRALAAGREVLDAFCYTGGFSVAALAGGAAQGDGRGQFCDRRWRLQRRTCASNSLECLEELHSSRPTYSPTSACCATRAAASTWWCSTRPSSRRPRHRRRTRRAPTRTSTCWRSSCSTPGGLLATFSCSGGVSGGTVPVHRRRRGRRRGRRREDHRAFRRGRGPSGRATISRGRLPQGNVAAARMKLRGTMTLRLLAGALLLALAPFARAYVFLGGYEEAPTVAAALAAPQGAAGKARAGLLRHVEVLRGRCGDARGPHQRHGARPVAAELHRRQHRPVRAEQGGAGGHRPGARVVGAGAAVPRQHGQAGRLCAAAVHREGRAAAERLRRRGASTTCPRSASTPGRTSTTRARAAWCPRCSSPPAWSASTTGRACATCSRRSTSACSATS